MKLKYTLVIMGVILTVTLLSIYMYTYKQENTKSLHEATTQEQNQENETITTTIIPKDTPNNLTSGEIYFNQYIEPAEKEFLAYAKNNSNNDARFLNLYKKYKETIDKMKKDRVYDYDEKTASYYENAWVNVHPEDGELVFNDKYIYNRYANYNISPAYKAWLKHLAESNPLAGDGGLYVTPDKLREYIIYLEKFTTTYPNFILKDDVQKRLVLCLELYISGLPNTPVFERWNGNKMNSDIKASYEKFLKENSDSKYYQPVEEFYNRAKQNNFIEDEKFFNWYRNEFRKKYFSENCELFECLTIGKNE